MSDYISREAAIEQFRKSLDGGYVLTNDAQTAHILHSIPAADVREVKRGKWEYSFYDEDGLEIVECVCSACHDYKESYAKWLYDDGNRIWFNFCPNCGAKMKAEGEE